MVGYGGSYIFSQPDEKNRKKDVLLEQIFAMSPLVYVGDKKYKAEAIIRAFKYFARSRTFYHRLTEDYELPNIPTLTRLTSKVNKIDDTQLLKNVFCNDEVYVKPALMYDGATIFGKAINKPNE